MSELLDEQVEKNDISIFDQLDPYEHTLSKLQNICRRILNTQPHMDLKHVTAAYRVSSELECIGDIITFISKHLRKLKRMPEIKEGTVRVAKLLSIMTEAYFSSSLPLISRHSKETRATEEWLEENAMRADPSTYFKLAEICHLIREITIEVIYPFEN
jgi:hypothetical protein